MKHYKSIRHIFCLFTMLFVGLLHSVSISADTSVIPSKKTETYQQALSLKAARMRGDVDNDGERSIVDVTILVEYIINDTISFEYILGDLNDDGEISITDITILVNIILGGEYNDPDNPSFPTEGNEGGDPATGL